MYNVLIIIYNMFLLYLKKLSFIAGEDERNANPDPGMATLLEFGLKVTD